MSCTVGLQRIKKDWLLNIKVSLPPLAAQLAIADKLDKLQFLIDLKKQAITKTDELAKSIFSEMFGDPMKNEKVWEVKEFGKILQSIRY
jgi:type I restriction enzyme S subunit